MTNSSDDNSSVFNTPNEISRKIVKSARMSSDFDDIKCIGEGGFGKVFSGTHKIDKRICAIKCIGLQRGKEDWPTREVSALVSLSHENVLQYIHTWMESVTTESNQDQEEQNSEETDELFEVLSNKMNKVDLNDRRKSNPKPSSSSAENNNDFTFCHKDDTDVDQHSSFSDTNSKTTESSYSKISSQQPTNNELHVQKYLYIVTELCHEHNLCHRLLIEHRPSYNIDRLEGLKIFYEIVHGMTYIHEHAQKLIHRDLKPANIFFSLSNKTVKIGDFGLAMGVTVVNDGNSSDENGNNDDRDHYRNEHYSTTHPSRGTPSYRSPEQSRNEQPTQKGDIYAMGLILLELLYPMSTGSERKEVFENAKSVNVELPKDFDQIVQNKTQYAKLIRRLIAQNKDDRPIAKELHEHIQRNIDPEDYQALFLGTTATKSDVRPNKSRSHLLIEKTLCNVPDGQLRFDTTDIQYGTFDVCDKYDVILVHERNWLKLFDHSQQIDELRWQCDSASGFVSCIHWCSFLDQYLILSNYRLYSLPLMKNPRTSAIHLGRLTHLNQISAHLNRNSTPPPQPTTNIDLGDNYQRQRLRFITSSPESDGYLYLNRDYRFIEKWNMNSWQQLQEWSKEEDLGYDQKDVMRLITCSIDGSYLAINVRLKGRQWIVDFRETNVAMPLLKRISLPNDMPIYHKAQIPFDPRLWIMIQNLNEFSMVSSDRADQNIVPIETKNVQPTGDVCLHLRFFSNNQYLLVGTTEGKQGVLKFFRVAHE